jgi:hypothetical protein
MAEHLPPQQHEEIFHLLDEQGIDGILIDSGATSAINIINMDPRSKGNGPEVEGQVRCIHASEQGCTSRLGVDLHHIWWRRVRPEDPWMGLAPMLYTISRHA